MTVDEFFDSLAAMRGLVDEPALVDNPLLGQTHNMRARILRHGLSVSSFAMLEQFLVSEFQRFMGSISATSLSYSDMTESFRTLITLDAARGLINRLNNIDKAQRLPFFEIELQRTVRFNEVPPEFSWHGFRPSGSNIKKDDVTSLLRGLGVSKPWKTLADITNQLGSHRASLDTDFENIAKTRHTSAHNPTGNVPSFNLASNITVATLIACSFSLLLTALKHVYLSAQTPAQLESLSANPTISVRYIDRRVDGSWIERATGSGKAVKIYGDMQSARASVETRKGKFRIVVRNEAQVPLRVL